MRCATILLSLLLDGVEHSEARIAGGGEDHVSTFANLSE